jgi:CBS domain-containing protein
MTEQSNADRRTRPAVAPLIGTPARASRTRDAEPHDAEITDLAQYRCRADSGPRLSAASAASVREAAIAVLSGGVGYLPVVEDGVLVGLVAVERALQPLTSGLPAAHAHPRLSTAHGRRAR